MEPSFWLDRWRRNEIGFHQDKAHAALDAHWHRLGLAPGARVLVPLAGKSRDMVWLAEHGFEVLGVELSVDAVKAFFAERGVQPLVETLPDGAAGALQRFAHGAITLLCGDIFDLTPELTGPFAAIFDRAALVALPPAMRQDYARHMQRLSDAGTQTLLVTLEYAQTRMAGPPHNVSAQEVHELYGAHHKIELLARDDQLADFQKFAQRGLDKLSEVVWLLT